MGRFSSVQAFADNNNNVRKVAYAEVADGSNNSKGVVKTEKVVNAYGSTAGAGSGEFHVYRHARAREMKRLKTLDELDENERKEFEYQKKLEQNRIEEEARTEKRRKKRQRQKQSKERKKNLEKAGICTTVTSDCTSENDDDDEFVYVPVNEQQPRNDDVKQASELNDSIKQPSANRDIDLVAQPSIVFDTTEDG